MFEKLGQIWSLLLLAFALGLDGFSVCLGIGLQNLRLKRIAVIGLAIGSVHVILPFAGLVIGNFISAKLENITTIVGGSILIFIGAYMIISTFQVKTKIIINPIGLQLASLSILVSIDSFPVGISLGLSGVKTAVIIIFFGIFATCLSWLGLLIGKRTSHILGVYSEIFGGAILFIFGLHYIFS